MNLENLMEQSDASYFQNVIVPVHNSKCFQLKYDCNPMNIPQDCLVFPLQSFAGNKLYRYSTFQNSSGLLLYIDDTSNNKMTKSKIRHVNSDCEMN